MSRDAADRVPAADPGGPAPSRETARAGAARWRWAVGAVLLLALVLRLGFIAATPGYRVVDDARDYDAHARSIAAGRGFAHLGPGPTRRTAFRPPGFPYVLGGVYALAGRGPGRIVAGRVANALVGTAIVALIGLLAAPLLGRRIALAAMALAAVYVPLILIGGSLMAEPLFTALLLAALVAAVRHRRSARSYRWAALAGALGGAAILTRANGMILLAPLAIAVWDARPRWSRRGLAPPVLLVATAALVVSPWTVRNALALHAFVPVTTQLGWSLAGTYNDAARADRENPASWRSLRRVRDYQDLTRPARWREVSDAELARRLRAAALRYAADHPGYVADVAFWNTVRALDLAGRRWSRHTASTIGVGPRWADAGVVAFWLAGALAAAGAATARARRIPWFVAAVPALLYLSVVLLAFETPRYRTPIEPFVLIAAAVAVVEAWDALRVRAVRPPRATIHGER